MSITKISDYAAATNHASNIATIADEMKKTLDNTGREMDDMYGTNWQSSGAAVTREQFEEKRQSFDVFYQNVLSMRATIDNAVAEDQKTDDEAKAEVSSVYNSN